MMKKILGMVGTLLTIASPVVVAISCGTESVNKTDVIKSIGVQDIFSYIKSDENQLPTMVTKPQPFNLEVDYKQGKHAVKATVTKWDGMNAAGEIHYTLELVYGDAIKEISGILTNYLTQDMYDTKTFISEVEIVHLVGMPAANPNDLPSNIQMPTLTHDTDASINVSVVEWNQQDSNGLIYYEVEVSKNGFKKNLNGSIQFKDQGQHDTHWKELDVITHASFYNFPISNSNQTTDDIQLTTLDKNGLLLHDIVTKSIKIENVTWVAKKDKGEIHWEIELSHNDIHTGGKKTISGVITGFMTQEQHDAKTLIDGLTFDQLSLTGLPTGDTSKLPSEINQPTISSTQNVNLTVKLWDQRDSFGEIEYQIEIEKMGFKKIFTKTIVGYQTTQDREDLILLDSIHPESLLDFPSPDSNLLPSEIASPILTTPIEGMTVSVVDWKPSDYAGIINWKIEFKLNGKIITKEGVVQGFAPAPWNSTSDQDKFPQGLKFLNSMYSRTINGDLAIPDSVEKIGPFFLNGSQITGNVSIPNNFDSTSGAMFWGVTIQGTLDMSNNTLMTTLDNQSFSWAAINHLILPNSIKIIKPSSFSESTFQDFSISNLINLEQIQSYSFSFLTLPSNFALPTQKVQIHNNSFQGSFLPDGFVIPSSYDPVEVSNAFDHTPRNGRWELNRNIIAIPKPGAIFKKN